MKLLAKNIRNRLGLTCTSTLTDSGLTSHGAVQSICKAADEWARKHPSPFAPRPKNQRQSAQY